MTKSIGAPKDRVDGVLKVTGMATYTADMRIDGQLIALSVRSTIAAGRIATLRTTVAEAIPGVVAIYTHENAPRLLDWRISNELTAISAEGLGLSALPRHPRENASGYLPLTTDRVIFGGQWIAVVVAESVEVARHAAGSIAVEYEPSPAAVELDETKENWLEPTFFFGADMQVHRGAVIESMSGNTRVRSKFETAMQLHQPMEPSVTLAYWQGESVTIYDSTQGVYAARDYIARSLRLATDKVKVVATYVGGGFGSKNQMWPHQALAAHIARAVQRPVRLQLTRADMAVASGHRSKTSQEIALVSDREGHIRGLRHISSVPTSVDGGFFEPCGLNTPLLYETDNLEVRHRVQRMNIATPTPFRAPGEAPGSFSLESALDELAHQLTMDPLELRRRNFARRDNHHGREWSSNHLLDCYRLGAEAFGWPGAYVEPRSMRADNEMVGYGMATTAYPAPSLTATVRVRLLVDGRAIVETSATDIGTGMCTILSQAVSDELDLPMARVEVRLADSTFPHAPTAGRSKSTASVLPAAKFACRSLIEQLTAMTPISGTLETVTQMISKLSRAGLSELVVEGSSPSITRGDLSFFSFGAHFVEVRVDEQLARLRVSRIVSAFDCGRIINPKTAASQVKGAIVFGIGMALMEEVSFDPSFGRIVNDNLADYHVPVNADVPDIEVLFVDEPDVRFNEFGARGLGEIGVPGVAAAITNAVYSATGRRVRNLPISLASLLPEGA